MSSTNRGAERRTDDAYMTPGWCVRRLLDAWKPQNGMLLEPAVGDGAIIKAFDQVGLRRPWVSFDVRDVSPVQSVFHSSKDFLTVEALGAQPAAVVTNPPYCLAEEFIRHARKLCPHGDLVFLLRIAFLASSSRLPLWRDLGTPDIYVLPNRPSFTGNGTDSADYAWFRWPSERRSHGALSILGETSVEERKAAR